jgi:hypothetical protein
MRRIFVATLLAAAAGAFSLPAAARGHVDVFVGVAPPALPFEAVPAPRPGWVWVPGVWSWEYGRYVWIRGHWIAARPGFVYAPAGWVRWHHGWRWRAGAWAPVHRFHRW